MSATEILVEQSLIQPVVEPIVEPIVPQLHIQRLLRSGKNLKKICFQNDIKVVPHKTIPHLVTLKYMDKANPLNKVTNQARGTIISILPEDNFKVVALPYFRFYNHGEKFTDVIDWNSTNTRVLEKLDGSLVILYYYEGSDGNHWRFATSGTPDAYGMSSLINKVWKKLGYRYPNEEDKDKTFMFELCTLNNKIVVPYETERMVLHGVRSIITFKEELPDAYATKYGYELIKSYPVNNFDDAHKMVLGFDPKQTEGCVYVDHLFRRVKDKNPEYVVLSKTAEGDSIECTILKTIFTNDSSEFLSTNPDKIDLYNDIYNKYITLCKQIEQEWNNLKDIPDRKTFFQTINTITSTNKSLDTSLAASLDAAKWYKNCLLEMYTIQTKNTQRKNTQQNIRDVDINYIYGWINKQNPMRVLNFFQ